jgi:hypothetical protein
MRIRGWYALAGLLFLGLPARGRAQESDGAEAQTPLVVPDTRHIVRAMARCDEASIRAVLSGGVTNGFEELEERAANPREHVLDRWRDEPGGHRELCGVVLKAIRHGFARSDYLPDGLCAPALACRSDTPVPYREDSAVVMSPAPRDQGPRRVVRFCARGGVQTLYDGRTRVCVVDGGRRTEIRTADLWSEEDMVVDFMFEDGRLVVSAIGRGC